MEKNNLDYVDVIYNETDRPLTDYPQKLVNYLFQRYRFKKGAKLLDVGCGRGEFLKSFINCGFDGHAVDQSNAALKYCPDAKLKIADVEIEGLPFDDNTFDVVYSKSVLEHFHRPEKIIREIYRVLKPGGLVITLCPSWEYNYRIYFEDYTHRTPFMLGSLRDIHLIHNFNNVKVEFFRQLPSTWYNFSFATIPLAELTRILLPDRLKPYSKWVRFSKEVMLLSSAIKPFANGK